MKIEEVFHMVGGCGVTSYANNSKLQEKAIFEIKPLVEGVIKEICSSLLPKTFVVADLGCSTGPNAISVLSMINNFIDELYNRANQHKPEIQFFLNDLPSNDFNNLFQLLALYSKRVDKEKGNAFVSFYVTGLPGSFYRRLLPSKSVHFFHSSYCLMWLSQVPKGLKGEYCAHLTKGNIYINEEIPSTISNLYLEQFKRDFSTFLKNRSKELLFGGSMILSFLGSTNPPSIGGHIYLWGLLSEVLNEMVTEGLVEDDKLNAFNLPMYTPLMEEVKSIIEMEGSFHLIHAHTFESNWDPFDESDDEFVVDNDVSGENVAKCIRAMEWMKLYATAKGIQTQNCIFSSSDALPHVLVESKIWLLLSPKVKPIRKDFWAFSFQVNRILLPNFSDERRGVVGDLDEREGTQPASPKPKGGALPGSYAKRKRFIRTVTPRGLL